MSQDIKETIDQIADTILSSDLHDAIDALPPKDKAWVMRSLVQIAAGANATVKHVLKDPEVLEALRHTSD